MTESSRDITLGADLGEYFLELSGRSSDYALFLVGPDGLIRGWNSGAERLYGYKSSEIVGRLFSELFSIEDAMQGIGDHDLIAANHSGSSASLVWQTRKDGTRFHCNANITAITDEKGDGRVFAIVVQDRHSRQQADEHATKSGELIDFYEANKTFFTMLAHDIRVPLAPISAAIELIKHYESNNSQSVRVAEILQRQLDVLKHHIGNMLDVSRFSLTKFTLKRQPVELSSLVKKVAENFQRLAEVESRVLHLDCGRGPIWAEVDAIRIEQVLVNLLENAVKFTSFDGAISITLCAEQGEAFVKIRDNGIGLSHCDIPEIFQVFTSQPGDVAPGGRDSRGLGLALAKAVADLHGGSLTAHQNLVHAGDSIQEEGCEFVLRLPLTMEPQSPDIAEVPSLPPAASSTVNNAIEGPIRVLLVTDQLDYGLPLSMLLKVNGCVVHWTQLPNNLEQEIAEFQPSVILLDMSMKCTDPFDIAAQVNNSKSSERPRLIALTDEEAIDSDIARGRNSSMQTFVTKSDDFSKLQAALTSH